MVELGDAKLLPGFMDAHTHLTVDVVPGRGGMFSLDNGREKRFLTRSEICRI